MIQVNEALSVIAESSTKASVKKIKVAKSLGFVLAETIYSPIDMPPFRQSAMDGYAFLHSEGANFEVVNTIQAGSYLNLDLQNKQAIRLFTGAYVPDGLDTVVMQEHTKAKGDAMEIIQMPKPFANVRNKGEQIKKGEIVLEKHTQISPAAIGFLSTLGLTEIAVYSKPKVAIIVTGNELVKAGSKLPLGKIYESNSAMLKAALQQIGVKKTKTFRVKDDLISTQKVLKKSLSNFDLVLVSGGISVGDYDFVKEALLSNGVEERFYKVNQKPGKPLFFGKKNQTLVFALPGNPASTLSCFYVYVLPALKKMMGFETTPLSEIKRKMATDIKNNSGKALFLKAFYDQTTVRVLDSQSSAMLNTFAVANGLIYLPFDLLEIKKGATVSVLPID